jgi:hypothetical protein
LERKDGKVHGYGEKIHPSGLKIFGSGKMMRKVGMRSANMMMDNSILVSSKIMKEMDSVRLFIKPDKFTLVSLQKVTRMAEVK